MSITGLDTTCFTGVAVGNSVINAYVTSSV